MAVNIYHSALRAAKYTSSACDRVEFPDGVAFVHDLACGGLPEDYRACDVLYAEIPWIDGWDIFYKRASREAPTSHPVFLKMVSQAIIASGLPSVIPCGKRAVSALAPPVLLDSKLNGGNAMLCLFNGARVGGAKSAEDALEALADRYSCVGDFACGYGRAGRVFRAHGKRFVMSDINPYCIGFIRDTMGGQ